MIVRHDKSFLKDYGKLKKDSQLIDRLQELILNLREAESLQSISNFKYLEEKSYRIRLGDYRIGFRMENKEHVTERLLHRKEIYKYYLPK